MPSEHGVKRDWESYYQEGFNWIGSLLGLIGVLNGEWFRAMRDLRESGLSSDPVVQVGLAVFMIGMCILFLYPRPHIDRRLRASQITLFITAAGLAIVGAIYLYFLPTYGSLNG